MLIRTPIQKTNGVSAAVPDAAVIRAALQRLDPNMGREVWFKIACGLHNSGYEYELFQAWSRGDFQEPDENGNTAIVAAYDEPDCAKTWASLAKPRDGKPITIGTVIKLAKDKGWKPAAGEVSSTPTFEDTHLEVSECLLDSAQSDLLLVNVADGETGLLAVDDCGLWQVGGVDVATAAACQEQRARAFARISDRGGEPKAFANAATRTRGWLRPAIRKSIADDAGLVHRMDAARWPDLRTCEQSDLDAPGEFLGVANGVINLRTGQLLDSAAGADKLITKSAPTAYNPQANVAAAYAAIPWPSHLKDYLLSEVAYSLLGRPTRRFVVLLGETGGGKTSIFSVLRECLGSGIAVAVHPDVVQAQKGNRSGLTPEVVPLVGSRLAVIDEAENLNVDSGRLKALSGDSMISYRNMYQTQTDGIVTATMFLPLNAPPVFGLGDEAVYERLRVVEVPQIENPTANWVEQQRPLHGAWLTLLVNLCQEIIENGGLPPTMPADMQALKASMADEEIGEVGVWLRTCLQRSPGEVVSTREIWQAACLVAGADADDDKAKPGGFTKRKLSRAVRATYKLPSPGGVRDSHGPGGRGWDGWALA